MPILSVTSISKMYMTATNFDWGFNPSSIVETVIDEEEDEEEKISENDIIVEQDSLNREIGTIMVNWKGKRWEMKEAN